MKRSQRPRIHIKNDAELDAMRRAGRLVADTLRLLRAAVQPGIETAALDRMAEEFIRDHKGKPSFKGYHGFPASICASVNEQVVHGFPSNRRLIEGDIISIDVGAIVDGFHGDAAITVPVGEIADEVRQLLVHTRQALYEGIKQARVGNRLSDVSHAVQTYSEGHGYSVVRELVGHGIGRNMHEEPQVPNYGPPGQGPHLVQGMTFALEPMVNMGGADVVLGADQWTISTRDGLPSAHFEHTLAIGANGAEILTPWADEGEPI